MATASPSGDSLRCLGHSCHTSTCCLRPVSLQAEAGVSPESSCPSVNLAALTASVLPSVSPLGLHSLQETYEAKRKEFLSELQRKEEEMRQMFVNKVKETELELKEKEREVCASLEQGWGGECQRAGWLGCGWRDLSCPYPGASLFPSSMRSLST